MTRNKTKMNQPKIDHIVALTGSAATGRTMIAAEMRTRTEYRRVSFEDPIYVKISEAYDCTFAFLKSPKCMDNKIDGLSPFYCEDPDYRRFLLKNSRSSTALYDTMSSREHLSIYRRYSEEKNNNPGMWANPTIPGEGSVIIPDLSNQMEYQMLHRNAMLTSRPLIVVALTRPGFGQADVGLPANFISFTVESSGNTATTTDDLCQQLEERLNDDKPDDNTNA